MSVLRGVLNAGAVLLATAALSAAQVGPPVCPLAPGAKAVAGAAHERPSVKAAEATAERDAADPSMLVAAEPMENFGVARYRLADYADCVGDAGCYWADLDAQTRRAEAELDRIVADRRGEKLAIVLDIDETSLSSYCEMKREDFGYIAGMFNEWVVSPEASVVIPGTLRLFNKARAEGVNVFFITGRPDGQREGTVKNLEAAGYSGWKGLSLRVGEQKKMPTVEYKSEERRKIVAAGYRIVMSVGDQWSDLNGDPKAEVSVKLPNPFYYLP